MLARRIKVGVVGLGIGRWHIESYLAIPEVKVSAICDIDAEKLKSIAVRYGIMKTYTDYEELCQSDSIDAISICVPNYMHAPVAVCALENGKHILCEKPLSSSLDAGIKVLETAKRFPNLKAMVAMKFRFSKDVVYIKRMIENGGLGDIYYGSASYLKQPVGNSENGGWLTKKEFSGGGTLIDNGIHVLDLVWWLMDCPKPLRVFGSMRYDIYDVEELGLAVIEFENGIKVLLESVWSVLLERETIRMRLCGSKCSATLWPFRISYEQNRQVVSETPDLTDFYSENQFKHFINCIIDNKPPIPTIQQGVEVLRIIDAIYRSADEGKPVDL